MFVCSCVHVGGGGHNLVNIFIDFFHVSDHLEQFVGVFFVVVVKLIISTDGGSTPQVR